MEESNGWAEESLFSSSSSAKSFIVVADEAAGDGTVVSAAASELFCGAFAVLLPLPLLLCSSLSPIMSSSIQ